ncbi:MAG: outer membrane lipoprotein-sorting protein [Spirochaetes bacterium]|nr:outer membrane lipoprotein-sorting protein [Spirochaetota bacterium]
MKKILLIIMLVFITAAAEEIFAEPSVIDLMKKVEKIQEMTTDIRAKVEMTQQKVDQGIKKIDMIYYRRDSDDSFLIVMVAPESDKGNGYLRVGENFWMYRRNTRTFQHVNRDENIGGSNARAQDFEMRKLTELYEPAKTKEGREIIKEEMLGKIPVYRFEITAKVTDVDYPKKTYWIRKDNYLPLKELSYSLNDTLMGTAYYRKYTVIDGRYVAIEMLFIDEFEKGNKTLVEISGISTEKLNNYLFTKPYLENLSK